MRVVLYIGDDDRAESKRLWEVVESVVSSQSLEVLRSIDDLMKRLRHIPRRIDVAVILARNDDHLSTLVSVKDYLEPIRVILILTDRIHETISKGHKLYPRFLTFSDSDFSDVAAVLTKMIGNMGARTDKIRE